MDLINNVVQWLRGLIQEGKERRSIDEEIENKIRKFVVEGSKINLDIEKHGLSKELKIKMESLMCEIDNWMSQICESKGVLSKEDEEQKGLLMSDALHLISLAIDRETSYQKESNKYLNLTREHFMGVKKGSTITIGQLSEMYESLGKDEEWAIVTRGGAAKSTRKAERFCRKAGKKSLGKQNVVKERSID